MPSTMVFWAFALFLQTFSYHHVEGATSSCPDATWSQGSKACYKIIDVVGGFEKANGYCEQVQGATFPGSTFAAKTKADFDDIINTKELPADVNTWYGLKYYPNTKSLVAADDNLPTDSSTYLPWAANQPYYEAVPAVTLPPEEQQTEFSDESIPEAEQLCVKLTTTSASYTTGYTISVVSCNTQLRGLCIVEIGTYTTTTKDPAIVGYDDTTTSTKATTTKAAVAAANALASNIKQAAAQIAPKSAGCRCCQQYWILVVMAFVAVVMGFGK